MTRHRTFCSEQDNRPLPTNNSRTVNLCLETLRERFGRGSALGSKPARSVGGPRDLFLGVSGEGGTITAEEEEVEDVEAELEQLEEEEEDGQTNNDSGT